MSLNQNTIQEIRSLFVIGLIKKCSYHYKMLIFSVRHGMIVDKFHEMISFKQSNLLKKL